MNHSPYLRESAAAAYISMSPRYLRKLVQIGMLPAFKLGKRAVLFRRTDLDAMMESCRIGKAVAS